MIAANDTMQMCCNMRPFLNIIRYVIVIIQFSVPLLLIILGTVDMFKAMTKGDEKENKKIIDTFVKRLIYGVVIFIVPFLVKLVLQMINDNILNNQAEVDTMSWLSCFNYAMEEGRLKKECSSYEDIYKPD